MLGARLQVIIHFLKSPQAMRYVRSVIRWARVGEPRHERDCCARMVWHKDHGNPTGYKPCQKVLEGEPADGLSQI